MFPIFLVQIALVVIIVRSIFVIVKSNNKLSGLEIAYYISIILVAASFLLPHNYSYYIH